MFVSLILMGGLICDLLTIFVFKWVNEPKTLWILPVAFIVGMIIAILIILLVLYIGSLFVDKNKEYVKPSKFHHRAVMRVCEMLVQIFRIKVHYRGFDKLPQDKKFLFVFNHQSMFDPISAVWTLRGFPIVFVMKQSLLKIPLVGKYLYASGFLGLNRENPREGVKTINKASSRIEEDILSIGIAPEGTRSKKYEMNEFHSGSFKIALKAKCPIVLCCIQNTCKVYERFKFKSTKVYYDIVEVIPYEDIENKTTQEISDYSYEVIKNNLENLPKY